jgi:aminopeptidase N
LDADRNVDRVRLAPFVAFVAVVFCAAVPAGAQAVRPYNPSIDVVDYDLTIDLPHTGSIIRGRAVLTIKRTAPTDTLVLDLLDLGVDRVTVDGNAARFRRDPERVIVPLPKGRTNMKVAVEYSGAVTDGLIVRTDSAGRWTGFGDNWPNRGRHWIPGIDHPSDKATVTWTVRGPSERTVVANGRLVSRRAYTAAGKARTETKWRETRPIPVYLMVIAAAPLTMFDLGDTSCGLAELQRCVAQSVYTAPEQARLMPGPFSRAGEMVQLFSRLVGPFPYEKLSHLQSSTRFGGMENASAIFYSDNGVRRGSLGEGTVAHEIAHQWFGDAVTEREWPHVWLSEGFATYFAALWTRAARGDSAFRREMADIRRRILDDSASVTRRPVIDTIETSLLALLNRNSYEKGGFVLHMLRTEIGERAFFDGIRAYYAKHKHGTALTDDLRAEMERASGKQLGWFFDQWLRRPGYPSVQVEWAYDATTREVKVTVSQGARFGAFQMPIAIAVIDSTGVAQRVRLALPDTDGATTTARTPSATAPASVVVDPDVVALANISVVRR